MVLHSELLFVQLDKCPHVLLKALILFYRFLVVGVVTVVVVV